MKTFASICTGGGLADVGATMAGYKPIWGIEIDPTIAEVARFNLKHDVIAKSVFDVAPSTLERPDVLWASPPCPNFSVAKTNAQETELDQALAQAIVDFVSTLKPPVFILENVEGYKRSKSLKFIEGGLYALGYWVDRQIINAADFGVPQTRRRLILRAVLGGFPPALPQKEKWVGWYSAIADLISTLPESRLAQWQIDGLPEPLVSYLFQVENPNGNRSPKAILISGTTNRGETVSFREGHEPALTVMKSSDRQAARAWMGSGRVVAITPRALARFQTLPDFYALPEKSALACKIIGNGVPCILVERFLRLFAL
jgi:DNA (cytosine-5)-methyltransferase 1